MGRRFERRVTDLRVRLVRRLPHEELTAEERRLELVLRLFSLLFAAFVIGYLLQGLLGPAEFPFVANSVAKDGMFAVLAFIAAGDIRQNGWAGQLVIAGHILIVASLLFMLFIGHTDSVEATFGVPFGIDVDPTLLLFIWLALAGGVIAVLWLLYRSAARSRYALRYLMPHQHRTAMAMAEVLVIGEDEALTPEEVAAGIDDYLFSFAAHDKWKAKLALSVLTVYPMFRFRPPFALISPDRRLEFIERCFIDDVVERRLPGFLRQLVQSMLFATQQLAIIGYYGDPRSAESTGFVPFTKRPRYKEAVKNLPRERPGLVVSEPSEIDAERVNADVAIIGSGAAGAVLAYRLAERGREVVVLEGGKHVDPRDFTEDERVQFSNLYADGAMQMSRDARFQVLQGKCVGGSTVVNNAVCLDIPPPTLKRWNDPDGLDAGIDEERLMKSFEWLREWLPVYSQKNGHLQAGGTKMAKGIKKLRLDTPASVVHANIKDCLGSGYCNMGCAYGKKLSALDNILPRAQAEYGDGVRIFSECLAERIETSGGRATEIRLPALGRAPASGRRQHRGGRGRRARLKPAAAAQRTGREAGGHGAQLQRRRAAHRRFRAGAARVRRAADHPYLPARGRGPAHPRVLVQPGGDPGDADAGLVLGPLQQHAPLRPPELHWRRRRLAAKRPRQARLPGQGNEA